MFIKNSFDVICDIALSRIINMYYILNKKIYLLLIYKVVL